MSHGGTQHHALSTGNKYNYYSKPKSKSQKRDAVSLRPDEDGLPVMWVV